MLGVALGAGLLALTARGVKMFTPETLEIGMAKAVVTMVLGLVAGFTVPALVALFRTSGIAKSSTAGR